MASILFPLGVRLSTWIAVAAFLGVWSVRRDRSAIFAAAAWLTGFEAAYQATAITMGHPVPHGMTLHSYRLAAPAVVGLAAVPVAFAVWYRVRPAWWLMAAAAAVWVVWVAVGFPVNQHGSSTVDPLAEVMNESAKTLWAVAYLLVLKPGLMFRPRERNMPRVRGPVLRGSASYLSRPTVPPGRRRSSRRSGRARPEG